MRLRVLTPEGHAQMQEWLIGLKQTRIGAVPDALLRGHATSIEPPNAPTIHHQQFGSRLSFAAWVAKVLETPGLAPLAREQGFWSWLTLFLFDEVCPKGDGERRAVGELGRYIPQMDTWNRYYRHLLLGPYLIYKAYEAEPMRAMTLLIQPLSKPGELVAQIAGRQELVRNGALLDLLVRMYLNRTSGGLKRGVGGKSAGSARHLGRVLQQFDLTYDLLSMNDQAIAALLPEGFRKFLATSP